jgi:hypothetical protein
MVERDRLAVEGGNEHGVLSRCCLRISPVEATDLGIVMLKTAVRSRTGGLDDHHL